MADKLRIFLLVLDFLLLLGGVVFLICTFTVDRAVPLNAPGNLIAAQGCVETCVYEGICNYLGNVSVVFSWQNLSFQQNFALDGNNAICQVNCCATIIAERTPIFVLLVLLSNGLPQAYDFALTAPAASSSHQTLFFSLACGLVFSSTCLSFMLFRYCRTRPVYESLQ